MICDLQSAICNLFERAMWMSDIRYQISFFPFIMLFYVRSGYLPARKE